MGKTIAEINERIKKGKAVVVTAEVFWGFSKFGTLKAKNKIWWR